MDLAGRIFWDVLLTYFLQFVIKLTSHVRVYPSSRLPAGGDLCNNNERSRWYHGAMNAATAENILSEHEDFSFLVRKSARNPDWYALSIRY